MYMNIYGGHHVYEYLWRAPCVYISMEGTMVLLYDSKEPDSFHSSRWNLGTNPDLTFISSGKDQ